MDVLVLYLGFSFGDSSEYRCSSESTGYRTSMTYGCQPGRNAAGVTSSLMNIHGAILILPALIKFQHVFYIVPELGQVLILGF
ncbi:hypothetical protein HanRHA438_Chr15g0690951 [Helianthus annuus]|nr:hypothetical protein HanIR_Chr15g0737291 [Helianthus annuus]KAJ0843401.1 hypothetical protein HanRHA438_Chr15g0690951 [Helianthus annuus]